MSEQSDKQGPADGRSVQEVQGVFPSDAAMEDAIAKLTLAGFDRADFSLPVTSPAERRRPARGGATPMTDTDLRQARTMGTGMAGTIGAFAAAGATIATGGVAGVAIAAAAAVGVGSGLAANAIGTAAKTAQVDDHEAEARAGGWCCRFMLRRRRSKRRPSRSCERRVQPRGCGQRAPASRCRDQFGGLDGLNGTGRAQHDRPAFPIEKPAPEAGEPITPASDCWRQPCRAP